MYAGSRAAAGGRCCAAGPVFDQMRTELMCGQYLDVLEQAQASTTVERARHVIRYKTREVHRRAAAAARRRAGRRRRRRCSRRTTRYGLPLGEAFQLRDDVLGVFGDPADDRQAGRRRPARGQAHRAGRAGPRALLAGRRPRRCAPALGDPRLGADGVERAARGDRRAPARWPTVERLIAALTATARGDAWPRRRRRAGAATVLERPASLAAHRAGARLMRTVTGPDRPRRRRRRRARRAVRGAAAGRRRPPGDRARARGGAGRPGRAARPTAATRSTPGRPC